MTLTNRTSRALSDVVQIYFRQEVFPLARPARQLKAFQRVDLKAGETRQLTFHLPADLLADAESEDLLKLLPGKAQLFVGRNARDAWHTFELTLEGRAKAWTKRSHFYAAAESSV
jgi:beta-glucosidase